MFPSCVLSQKRKLYMQSVLTNVTIGPNAYNTNKSLSLILSRYLTMYYFYAALAMYKRIYYLQITTVIYREISEPSQLKMAYAHADICRILQGKK
jgi:hypothetical protein